MDFAALRKALDQVVVNKGIASHKDLPELCRKLGMPQPSNEGTIVQRLQGSFSAVIDQDLPRLAHRCLEQLRPSQSVRYAIQDLLWADDPGPIVSKRVRREIARSLAADDLYAEGGWGYFDALLVHLFVVQDELAVFNAYFDQPDTSLRAEIERHVHQNRGDWPVEYVFERLGAFDCCNRRFLRLLEGLASPEVRPDEDSQRAFVGKLNKALHMCGAELRETDARDGYPVFTVVPLSNVSTGRPKNIIFASLGKPDLRFRDAVNNDIEIVENSDKVLVYDRPIGRGGIRWTDLQAWWAEHTGQVNDDQAKRTLYLRLKDALPASSPPQTLLFRSFFEVYKDRFTELPALLPEVWLHWDPKTIKQRRQHGSDALARLRMDFLMLLPGGARVVIEVDGIHHYTDEAGQPSPAQYAAMVAADRKLRFGGYEVFRFGGAELEPTNGKARVKEFFQLLFKAHAVRP